MLENKRVQKPRELWMNKHCLFSREYGTFQIDKNQEKIPVHAFFSDFVLMQIANQTLMIYEEINIFFLHDLFGGQSRETDSRLYG